MRPVRPSTGLALALGLLAACGAPAAPAQDPVEAPAPIAAPVAPGEPGLEFANLPPPFDGASYAAGRRTWKLCQSCHMTDAGAGHGVGPNLNGVFGRKVASAPGYEYSDALKAESFTWTPEQLDLWLANPRGFVPGNRMSFAGVREPEDRTAVIAFLMIETGYEAPAP